MISPVSNQPKTLEAAIEQVNNLIKITPSSTLASMYKEIAVTTRDSALRISDKEHWSSIIEILDISSDDEIASEFKSWIEKTIATANPVTKKQFLLNVASGIIEVSRRS